MEEEEEGEEEERERTRERVAEEREEKKAKETEEKSYVLQKKPSATGVLVVTFESIRREVEGTGRGGGKGGEGGRRRGGSRSKNNGKMVVGVVGNVVFVVVVVGVVVFGIWETVPGDSSSSANSGESDKTGVEVIFNVRAEVSRGVGERGGW